MLSVIKKGIIFVSHLCTHKGKNMKVLTTREFRSSTKSYFELAEKERVSIKRGKKFVNLVISDDPETVFINKDWVREFFSIPEQYRCNPFDVSPSGDIYWADKRNVEKLGHAIQQVKEGKVTTVKTKEELNQFLSNL